MPTAVYAASVSVFAFLVLKTIDGLPSGSAASAVSNMPAQTAAPISHASPRAYYRNCREAWAAGAAPIYEGQPGYRRGLDGDDDGVACEPYHRR